MIRRIELRREGRSASLPLTLWVPPDAPETDGSDPDDRIEWDLTARGHLPGADYDASFELPVFVDPERPPREEPIAADTPPSSEKPPTPVEPAGATGISAEAVPWDLPPVFALGTLPFAPYFFLRSRTVVVSADGVEIRADLRTPDTVKQRLSLDRIEAVTPVDWSVSMGKRYWAVQITTPSGAEVAVATGFPEWSEAAWLAHRIQTLVDRLTGPEDHAG